MITNRALQEMAKELPESRQREAQTYLAYLRKTAYGIFLDASHQERFHAALVYLTPELEKRQLARLFLLTGDGTLWSAVRAQVLGVSGGEEDSAAPLNRSQRILLDVSRALMGDKNVRMYDLWTFLDDRHLELAVASISVLRYGVDDLGLTIQGG